MALPSLFLSVNTASIERPYTNHSTGVTAHSCQIAQPQTGHTNTCAARTLAGDGAVTVIAV